MVLSLRRGGNGSRAEQGRCRPGRSGGAQLGEADTGEAEDALGGGPHAGRRAAAPGGAGGGTRAGPPAGGWWNGGMPKDWPNTLVKARKGDGSVNRPAGACSPRSRAIRSTPPNAVGSAPRTCTARASFAVAPE